MHPEDSLLSHEALGEAIGHMTKPIGSIHRMHSKDVTTQILCDFDGRHYFCNSAQ